MRKIKIDNYGLECLSMQDAEIINGGNAVATPGIILRLLWDLAQALSGDNHYMSFDEAMEILAREKAQS